MPRRSLRERGRRIGNLYQLEKESTRRGQHCKTQEPGISLREPRVGRLSNVDHTGGGGNRVHDIVMPLISSRAPESGRPILPGSFDKLCSMMDFRRCPPWPDAKPGRCWPA